ncbi:hypothetical protein AB0O01_24105 [Streptomyces sp. NPDC093252]|uniref:hypothetical protein n=1 Tax=Streptomyces sp. NPDC093252 TaxID=3154980 RepID=UPI00343B2341
MYEYEIHRYRSDELIRQAEQARLARETVRRGRDARRTAEQQTQGSGATGEDHTSRRHRRLRFPRAA